MHKAWVFAALLACSPSPEAHRPKPPPLVSVSSAGSSSTEEEPALSAPQGALGEVITVAATKTSPQVDARALVWRAHPDDTFALALRFGAPHPPPPDPRAFGDSDAYLDELEVELIRPTGEHDTRRVHFPPTRAAGGITFWVGRTLFIDVTDTGVAVKWPVPATAAWEGGPVQRRRAGRWQVGVTSYVRLPQLGQTLVLRSGLVPIDVDPRHPTLADMLAAAEPERLKAGASNKPEAAVEGGFVAGTVLQIDETRYVARFAKPAIWAFTLTSVSLSNRATVIDVDTLEVSTCIAEMMHIDTPKGPRPVEDLRVGDVVWGWSFEHGERVATPVMGSVAFDQRPTVWIGGLQASPTHPVWDGDAWRAAGELDAAVPGARARVFALTVGPPHTYFAEGVLVHNKDRMYSDQLDDPWVFMWDPKREWWK